MKIRMKQRRLNQFLELVNSDFEKMMDGDKYSLAAHFLFSSPMSLFGKHQTGEQHWKAVIASLPKVQKLFKGFLNKIIGLKEGNALPLPPIRRLLLIEGDIFKILEEPTIPNVRGLKQLITIGIGDPFEEMLESDIGELGILLDGVPRSAFRKCKNPKCEKLFIHLSRKPKVFCSSSCAYTFLSRQRRDRIKKKIKKEGR